MPKVRLNQLFSGAPDVEVVDLVHDSRQVRPGSLFFCVSGFRDDGHLFAADAVERGAAALVVERPLGLGVPEIVVPLVRAEMAPAASRFFGDPSHELSVLGVTGTNGKTTTTFLLRSILQASGRRCGLIGTIRRVVGGREQPSERTTPEAIDLQRELRNMVEAGDEACALEVSSHGLSLCRCDATHFAATIFTNVTQDHLDFHHTMEEYFQAKRRLFVGDAGVAIINVDDPYGARLARELPDPCTYAIEAAADYRAEVLRTDASGSRLRLRSPNHRLDIQSPLAGRFNVFNALGAFAAATELGIEPDAIVEGFRGSDTVPGRFERVDLGQPYSVFVDYAHTPDALANVLDAARKLTERRLICVFGCAGDRDQSTRPAMGRIASRLCDEVILTSDNPNSEEPRQIIDEILAGTLKRASAIVDRLGAIQHAIESAQPGDTVLIAGRGHEQKQRFPGGRTVTFDDRLAVRGAVRQRVAGVMSR